uniref:hypothetical protein n=1 Tax=Candidatus Fimivicinus sp. TaxID=3056640 RepID=UPI003FEDED0D
MMPGDVAALPASCFPEIPLPYGQQMAAGRGRLSEGMQKMSKSTHCIPIRRADCAKDPGKRNGCCVESLQRYIRRSLLTA